MSTLRIGQVVSRCGLAGSALVVGLACSDYPEEVVVEHPDPGRYVTPLEEATPLTKSQRRALTGAEAEVSLTLGEQKYHIGEIDEPPDYVLGRIAAVVIDTHDNLIILDRQYQTVRVYDSQGEFVRSFGRPGAGPGEFMMPRALALYRDALLVGDLRNVRVTEIKRSRDGLELDQIYDLETIVPQELCVLSDRNVLIHGQRMGDVEGDLLHIADSSFTIERSFGQIYSAGNRSVQRSIATGHVSCSVPGKVLFAAAALPIVQAYDRQGTIAWTLTIEEFTPFPFIEYPDGRVVNPVPDEGGNLIAGLSPAPNGWVLLQIGRKTRESIDTGRPWDRLESYAVNGHTGTGVYLGEEYPRIVEVRDSLVVTVREIPFPRVTVYEANVNFPLVKENRVH